MILLGFRQADKDSRNRKDDLKVVKLGVVKKKALSQSDYSIL